MKSPQRVASAEHVVKRTLADGSVREYRYARRRKKQRPKAVDSLHALITAYQASPEWRALAKATKDQYELYLRPLWRAGHVTAKAVTRRDLKLVRNQIANERGNGAAFAFARTVSALFSWAVEEDWLDSSPATRLAKGLPRGHLKAWSQEEARAAIERLPEHLRRVVVLALYTGQRRGDLCSLSWSAYDGQAIKLVQQKTRRKTNDKPLVVPCHPALKIELDSWRRERPGIGNATILIDQHGRQWKPNMLSHALPEALVRIGLSNEINMHGLRKLAAANLAEAGCSANEIAAITGHTTLSMVELYTKSADQRRLADAAIIRLAGVSPQRSGER